MGRFQGNQRGRRKQLMAGALAAVKTEVSYKNDTIITIFFSPNKTKDTAKVALDSFNS